MILTSKKGLQAILAQLGAHSLPEIAGYYLNKSLIICGDAACIWDDLEAFGCRSDRGHGGVAKDNWEFMMVNRIGETFPGRIEHWYSNAPQLLRIFLQARRQEYEKEFGFPHQTHSYQNGAAWKWPWPGTGTSGLGAVLTGLGLGYERIVLCGLPLDNSQHNGEPHWRKTKFTTEAKDEHWKLVMTHCADRIQSMSGRTKDWFGCPT